jgi:hypothetical protein
MKREFPALEQLEAEQGRNKEIPDSYKEVILKTLLFFPELRDTHITFKPVYDHDDVHSPGPSVLRLLIPTIKRHYTVHILESAAPPHEQALLRNLPFEAQMAAIAHELSIIVQFENAGSLKAARLLKRGKAKERELRRNADISVIERGLGFELYLHASYLRRIPGFMELRKDIEVNSLNPHEILEALPPDQLQEVHRF